MADPASEGTTDAETYPVFLGVSHELEARVRFLLAQIGTEQWQTKRLRGK